MKSLWIIFALYTFVFCSYSQNYGDSSCEKLTVQNNIDFKNGIPIPHGLDAIDNLPLISWGFGRPLKTNFKNSNDIHLVDSAELFYSEIFEIDIVNGYSSLSELPDSVWTKDAGYVTLKLSREEYLASFEKNVKHLSIIGELKLSDNFRSLLLKVNNELEYLGSNCAIYLLNYNSSLASIIKLTEIHLGEDKFEIATARLDSITFAQFVKNDHNSKFGSQNHQDNKDLTFTILTNGEFRVH